MGKLVGKITERKLQQSYALCTSTRWCLVCRDLAVQRSPLDGRLKESRYTHMMSTETVDSHNNTRIFSKAFVRNNPWLLQVLLKP